MTDPYENGTHRATAVINGNGGQTKSLGKKVMPPTAFGLMGA